MTITFQALVWMEGNFISNMCGKKSSDRRISGGDHLHSFVLQHIKLLVLIGRDVFLAQIYIRLFIIMC